MLDKLLSKRQCFTGAVQADEEMAREVLKLKKPKPILALSLTGFMRHGPLSQVLSNLVSSSISIHIFFRTARRFYSQGTLSGTQRVNCLDLGENFKVKFMVGAGHHSACSAEGRLHKKLGSPNAKVKILSCISEEPHNGHKIGAHSSVIQCGIFKINNY